MFLHLGNGRSVNTENVIAIMDIEKASTSRITRDYLNRAGKSGWVSYCSFDMPKSFVVTLDRDLTERVYISSISPQTLQKRFEEAVLGKENLEEKICFT